MMLRHQHADAPTRHDDPAPRDRDRALVASWRQRSVELRAIAVSFTASRTAQSELLSLAEQWDAMAERKERWLNRRRH